MSAAQGRSQVSSQDGGTPVGATLAATLPVWHSADWPDAQGRPPRAVERRIAFAPMTEADLDTVCEVEKSAYTHPWSRKHFADSLAAGYPAMLLIGEALPGEVVHPVRADGRVLLGYLVAMPGVDEVHLLNITVAPMHQRQGWARFLLDALCLWSRGQRAQWLWLEVRASNAPARALYTGYGFQQVGIRKGYYPAGQSQREDAVVMSLNLVVARVAGGAA
jgi:[ribosomal protein S18]-alanine N-acetyltransferase